VSSVWIRTRAAKDGIPRFRVEYRPGGREERTRFAGSFTTKRIARIRAAFVEQELAAGRIPDLTLTAPETTPLAPTFQMAADAWRATRVDVEDTTRTLHRVALNRAMPTLADLRVDEIGVQHIIDMVSALAGEGRKRETIRKTVKYTAAVLDEHGCEPNPARDKRVRLPREDQIELDPPSAAHVLAVVELLPAKLRLPLLWLDWSGARIASVDKLTVGDYDEPLRRVRLRRSTTKTKQPLWVELPDVLADAIERQLGSREDRDPAARLFPDLTSDQLRTAIGRACKASGIPLWSPHDLRHRRISLLHRQGRSWAEIGRFVGQRKLSLTADTYTHVLVDGTEVDYAQALT